MGLVRGLLSHPERSLSLVNLNAAGGGVKDLEHHIRSPHWQPPVMSGASYSIAHLSSPCPDLSIIPHLVLPVSFPYSASRSLLFYAHCSPPYTSPEICSLLMPLGAYIEGRRCISRLFRGDMHPDDATQSVY